MQPADTKLTETLLRLIEEKLLWGRSEDWTHSNYEELGVQVSERSGISLSGRTIRRLFQSLNDQVDHKPQHATRDALAIFLGFKDWRDFAEKYVHSRSEPILPRALDARQPSAEVPPAGSLAAREKTRVFSRRRVLVGVAFLSVPVCWLAIQSITAFRPPRVKFSVEQSKGFAPFTTAFQYAFSGSDRDSLFLSRDSPRTRIPLPRRATAYNHCFLIPDFYRMELRSGVIHQ